jgi:hypothetical protein
MLFDGVVDNSKCHVMQYAAGRQKVWPIFGQSGNRNVRRRLQTSCAVPQAGSRAAWSPAKTVQIARIPATSTKNALARAFVFAGARRFAHPA